MDKRINHPTPRDIQIRRIRRRLGVNLEQARVIADLHFGRHHHG
jgi:hypothetical protein